MKAQQSICTLINDAEKCQSLFGLTCRVRLLKASGRVLAIAGASERGDLLSGIITAGSGLHGYWNWTGEVRLGSLKLIAAGKPMIKHDSFMVILTCEDFPPDWAKPGGHQDQQRGNNGTHRRDCE